ncbi:MAG: Lipoprotein signal peptidase (EC [uncultured Sulfurovum sp.]|uniref:Lipoprotein signal peptidase n=1 Tax=uncultured Sulfurovum sp. TaxID=269237 RepID=A0A6S6SW33_9BACT|nr:MAG: Lipoprotein signal peptidase (EC [uncultured Sulfurovum sp.]
MMRNIMVFLLVVVGTFIVDQGIKNWAMDAVSGVEYAVIMEGSCINLELFYNRGVAFSMLSSLADNLKWIQLVLIVGIIAYVFYEGYLKQYAFAIGLIVGGALGNVYDRFIHEGVVDYIAWHCGFDFAVFNYADVMINLGVAIILLMTFLDYRREKKLEAKK